MIPGKTIIHKTTCSTCGKKLKITEENLCTCGTPVCTKHRYHTEHECTRDFVHHPEKGIRPTKVVKI